eukprot:TRINITY_DN2572_c0_g1_i6.p1 TRINITY_DN2572_c0_g1~~TRINITY_DN2572_c0_g1_i6.p1  ORF type:complete len:193 (+),score=51.93 TRINITY_DN2572_c0_g1_i6:21-599(+)
MAIFPTLLAANQRVRRKDEDGQDLNCNSCEEQLPTGPVSSAFKKQPSDSLFWQQQNSGTNWQQQHRAAGNFASAAVTGTPYNGSCQQPLVSCDGFLTDCRGGAYNSRSRNPSAQSFNHDDSFVEQLGGGSGRQLFQTAEDGSHGGYGAAVARRRYSGQNAAASATAAPPTNAYYRSQTVDDWVVLDIKFSTN